LIRSINILVPIDFSDCSEKALAFVIQFADKIKANVLVLNVTSIASSRVGNPATALLAVQEQISQAKRRTVESVKKVTESVRSTLDEVPSIEIDVEVGSVESVICDTAAGNEIDYIMMGTQGENSILDKYLGSVASNVLINAPCPVMVIPEKTELPKKIVMGYATDFSDADRVEIRRAVRLFGPFQPEVKCVHFSGEQEFKEDKIIELAQFFAETASELNIEFCSSPVKNVDEFIGEKDINLLVMYKPQRTFFESLFHKSVTQDMAQHTNIPLLVLKETT
jgi:nucleotide-binding universal stress UspA family protein